MTDPTTTPPKALDASERALLGAYRAERIMPADAKAAVQRRLDERDHALMAPGGISTRWIAAGVGLAAAVVLAWGVSALRTGEAAQDTDDRKAQAAMHADDAPDGGVATPRVQPTTAVSPPRPEQNPTTGSEPVPQSDDGQPTSAASDTPPSDTPPMHTAAASATELDSPAAKNKDRQAKDRPAKGRPAKDRRSDPAAADPEPHDLDHPEPAPSPLSQERAILARAWAALADQNHSAALAEAQTHAQRFPRGTLGVERRAIQTIAACKARRVGWSDRATQFLAEHDKTPLARRVRQACAPKK